VELFMSQTIAHATIEARHHDKSQQLGFFGKYIWAEDHKTIAIQYLFACLFFLCVGGLLAMGVRYQLAFPGHPVPLIGQFLPSWLVGNGAIKPGGYNALVTMHATVMVFLVMMPLLVGVFGNFVIPLKIGARDMAFPFFNALSFWLLFVSGIVLLSGFFVPERTCRLWLRSDRSEFPFRPLRYLLSRRLSGRPTGRSSRTL
jgi:cytochrome c oxidase subunit I